MDIFLNKERLTVYPRIFIFLYIVIAALWILLGNAPTDPLGKPIGTDFIEFYSASVLARQGNPADAYNLNKIQKIQKMIIGKEVPLYAFNYPPPFLLLITPLSYIPYFGALVLWLSISFICYLLIVRKIAPHPVTTWLFLAFPGVFINISNGQSIFILASLLGGGLLLTDDHPFLAGFLFGLLSNKFHLALLVPIALLAGRKWKALFSTLITICCLVFLSIFIFGTEAWIAFLGNIPLLSHILMYGNTFWFKMPTFFAAARLIGFDISVAKILQAIVTIVTIICITWTWYYDTPHPIRSALLVIGAIFATPYAFDYDLALLGLPLAWIGWLIYKENPSIKGQILLLLVWLSPLITPIIAYFTKLQICPVILIVFFFFIIKVLKDGNKMQFYENIKDSTRILTSVRMLFKNSDTYQ